MDKIEEFVAWVAAMVFVLLQHRDKPWRVRVLIAGVSGAFGFSLYAGFVGIHPWVGSALAIGVVTALSYAILDTASALISDKAGIRAAVLAVWTRRSGKGGG